MQFSTPLFTITLTLPSLISASGFFDVCKNDNLWYSTLNADCSGTWTSIDLNQGISFNGADMIIGGNGFFGPCTRCDLDYSILGCYCNTIASGQQWKVLDLNEFISYRNGQMVFD